ncbi:hypothetical protein K402DRAFT_399044 [Aulographum hederae CBS 113979]|uniref:Uncharacterized protein n=1 Tax=Aulographum hederae CBS 113979 TaxID=1176131 RepID=A0A6G1GJJ6_9PEZI|nr:hypothetical protein K402DRAFT_399044 [Aulographum hederae CBS 113979]
MFNSNAQLGRQAFGLSAFEPVEWTPPEQPGNALPPGITRPYVQQYDDRGRPINPASRAHARALREAQNDVLEALEIVERKPPSELSDQNSNPLTANPTWLDFLHGAEPETDPVPASSAERIVGFFLTKLTVFCLPVFAWPIQCLCTRLLTFHFPNLPLTALIATSGSNASLYSGVTSCLAIRICLSVAGCIPTLATYLVNRLIMANFRTANIRRQTSQMLPHLKSMLNAMVTLTTAPLLLHLVAQSIGLASPSQILPSKRAVLSLGLPFSLSRSGLRNDLAPFVLVFTWYGCRRLTRHHLHPILTWGILGPFSLKAPKKNRFDEKEFQRRNRSALHYRTSNIFGTALSCLGWQCFPEPFELFLRPDYHHRGIAPRSEDQNGHSQGSTTHISDNSAAPGGDTTDVSRASASHSHPSQAHPGGGDTSEPEHTSSLSQRLSSANNRKVQYLSERRFGEFSGMMPRILRSMVYNMCEHIILLPAEVLMARWIVSRMTSSSNGWPSAPARLLGPQLGVPALLGITSLGLGTASRIAEQILLVNVCGFAAQSALWLGQYGVLVVGMGRRYMGWAG